MRSRDEAQTFDAADPLARLRDQFVLPDGVVYLDGNSLGALPLATPARVQQVVRDEWGHDLIRSWNTAGWITLSSRVGDKIARLIGAGPGEVVAVDSTSANLYKVLSAAVLLVGAGGAPRRRRLVSERGNFPTDLYIAESVARQHGFELVLVETDDLEASFDDRVAVVMLTHVNYRTGRVHPMAEVTRAAHGAGALVVWDLAHSAGALPVDVMGGGTTEAADFAVGCGYKYLNGGPGAPAFLWVHPTHVARMEAQQVWQPLSGWMGHEAPFDFAARYRPAPGIARFICGTPPVVSLAALECGVDTVLAAEPLGGMPALRAKSLALTRTFIALVEERCSGHDLVIVTPRDDAMRGSQVSVARSEGGYAIVQALIARGVVGDFRAPDVLRFGFCPLYTRFVDVWDAVEHLRQVLASGEWRDTRFSEKAVVT